jgi:hypothetical protein
MSAYVSNHKAAEAVASVVELTAGDRAFRRSRTNGGRHQLFPAPAAPDRPRGWAAAPLSQSFGFGG